MKAKSKSWSSLSLIALAVAGLAAAGCGKNPRFQADSQSRQILESALAGAVSCSESNLCVVDQDAAKTMYPGLQVQLDRNAEKGEDRVVMHQSCGLAHGVAEGINRLLGSRAFPFGLSSANASEKVKAYEQECRKSYSCVWTESDPDLGVDCTYTSDRATYTFGLHCTYSWTSANGPPIAIDASATHSYPLAYGGCSVSVTFPTDTK